MPTNKLHRGVSLVAAFLFAACLPHPTAAADDNDDAGRTGIYVMSVDGTQERRVASVEGFNIHGTPRWSHDGKRLAFDAVTGENEDVRKVFVVNFDGSDLKEVGEHCMPDWSPDDKQLIMQNDSFGSQRGIYVQNLDGTGRTLVADGGSPRYSPDGSKIAYHDFSTARVMDLASGEEHAVITDQMNQQPNVLEWSPDGKRLALVCRREGVPNHPRELLIVDADEPDKGLVVRFARDGDLGGHIAWSPEGKKMLVTLDSFIHVLDVDGTDGPRRLPGQAAKSRDPAWSPDGKWIAFARRPR